MALHAVNPATGETFQTYDEMTPAAVSDAITEAHTTFQDWKHTTFAERARVMQRAAHILRENASEYAVLMAQEMGKPIRDGGPKRRSAPGCASTTPSRRKPSYSLKLSQPMRVKALSPSSPWGWCWP